MEGERFFFEPFALEISFGENGLQLFQKFCFDHSSGETEIDSYKMNNVRVLSPYTKLETFLAAKAWTGEKGIPLFRSLQV